MTATHLSETTLRAARILTIAPVLLAGLIGAIPLIVTCITCRCCKGIVAQIMTAIRTRL